MAVMNAEPEYKRLQFTIADLLGLMVIVAVLFSLSRLPASPLHTIPLFAALYLAKHRILCLRVCPWLASFLYFLVVVALLPSFYCRVLLEYLYDPVMREWNGPLAVWIDGPIAAFTVPTASFFFDTVTQKRPSAGFYVRSTLEVLILVPLWWVFVWIWILDINAVR